MLLNIDLIEAKHRYLNAVVLQAAGCMLLISVIAALYASSLPNYSNKTHITEALSKISAYRVNVTQDYYQFGRWPDATILEGHSGYGITKRIVFDGHGTINVFFADQIDGLKGKVLSFSAAKVSNTDSSSILWQCGFAKLPSGFESVGHNITNLNPDQLPRSCTQ